MAMCIHNNIPHVKSRSTIYCIYWTTHYKQSKYYNNENINMPLIPDTALFTIDT